MRVHCSQLVEGAVRSVERFLIFFAHIQNGVNMLQHCSIFAHDIFVLSLGKGCMLADCRTLGQGDDGNAGVRVSYL